MDEVLPNSYTEPRTAKLSNSRELTPISKTDPADYVKELVFNYIYSTYGW